MKLFLTSSTITKNLVEPFENFLGKDISNLNVAFITDAMYFPDGANDPMKIRELLDIDMGELRDMYGWKLDEIRLSERVPSDFSKYDLIYVNGGGSGYLAKTIRDSGFEEKLIDLIKSDFPYVGSSGGSMVLSDIQDAASWFIDEPEPSALQNPGLGLIDFQIYPHFREDLKTRILENRNPELKYYLLKDGEAITVVDDKIEVLGEERLV